MGSLDGKLYEELTEILNFENKKELLFNNFHSSKIELKNLLLVKFIKIILLEPLYQFYGIVNVNIFAKRIQLINIISRTDSIYEKCIIFKNKKALIQDCFDSLLSTDNSDLWLLNHDLKLKPFSNQNLCLGINFKEFIKKTFYFKNMLDQFLLILDVFI